MRVGLRLLLELLGKKYSLSTGVTELVSCKTGAAVATCATARGERDNTEERREKRWEAGGKRNE